MKATPANGPKVSVLLPVRNGQKYLRAALRSVLDQTYQDFELVVLDDGSTDKTAAIIEREGKRDPRIVPKKYEGLGLPAVLNRGLAEAQGEYVARMDADDLCLPERFAEQVAALDRDPGLVLVGCQVVRIDSAGFEIDRLRVPLETEQIFANMLAGRGGQVWHPAFMFRAEASRNIGGYDEQFGTAQDFDFLLRIRKEGRIENLDRILLKYRMHQQSITKSRALEQQIAKRAALSRYLESLGETANAAMLAPPTNATPADWSDFPLSIAGASLRAGNRLTAFRNAAGVLIRSPRNSRARWLLVDSSPAWLQGCFAAIRKLFC